MDAIWLITPRGFFSAVEKYKDAEDGMVTVRARNRADIENLADLLPDAKPFKESFYTDYEWRVRVPKTDWAIAVARMAMEIDYSNFKSEVQRVQGKERSDVYHDLWFDLLKLEDKTRKGSYASGTGGYDAWDDDEPARLTPAKAKPKVQPKAKAKKGQQSPRRRKRSARRDRVTTKRQPARKAA